MRSTGNKKATRIFVARIPQSVDESMFRRLVEGKSKGLEFGI
jgi:RNA-binding protein Musashi